MHIGRKFWSPRLCGSYAPWNLENICKSTNNLSFYAPEIEDRGAYCFCPVCHSVILSETLTLLITFEQRMLELWYFTWVFLVIRPFCGYHYFLPCDLYLGVPFFENFNLSYNFWTVGARALIFPMSIPFVKTFFSWVPLFFTLWPWPWSLTNFLKTLTLLIILK